MEKSYWDKKIQFFSVKNKVINSKIFQTSILIIKTFEQFLGNEKLVIGSNELTKTIYGSVAKMIIVDKQKKAIRSIFKSVVEKHLSILFNDTVPVKIFVNKKTIITSIDLEIKEIFFTSIKMHSSMLIATYLKKNVSKGIKNQIKTINILKKTIKQNILNDEIRGVLVVMKGRVGGAERKKKIIVSIGKLKKENNFFKKYAFSEAFTESGVIGIHVIINVKKKLKC